MLLVGWLGFAPTARGQALENVIYSVGTTYTDGAGKTWAYVLWQGSDASLVQNRPYAIYDKVGAVSSPANYVRESVVKIQTEVPVISVLLERGTHLGDDLGLLEERVTILFQTLMPAASISLAEKVSIVIRGAQSDPNHFNNLILLSKVHPSINLCLGLAHAQQIPAADIRSFEIRAFDLSTMSDKEVVGRVTLDPAAPLVLPAPSVPVAIPRVVAKGDLNAKFRWYSPDPLKRLSLLSYGFNLYRMPRALAEGNSFHITPPTTLQLLTLTSNNPSVKRINKAPILKNREFTAASLADFVADRTNYFVIDDNRRFSPGGQPFNNGDQFYYFLTARDILGRDGLVSPGSLVTMCDMLPPEAPGGVQVVNDYSFNGGANKQVLKVRWKQPVNTASNVISKYYVYRWKAPSEIPVFFPSPASHRIAGPIAYIPGSEWNSYVDDGPGSPQVPADADKTFWYTVRAEDDGACGGNLSPHSSPVFGVLRDREGPAGPRGDVTFNCRRPVVGDRKYEDVLDRESEQRKDYVFYTLECKRQDKGIEWAEFYVDTVDPTNYLGRFYYGPADGSVQVPYLLLRSSGRDALVFACRVGSVDGEVSSFSVHTPVSYPQFGFNRHVLWQALTFTVKTSIYNVVKQRDCDRHVPTDPTTGTVDGVDVVITLTPGTKEFKLYRRIDDGTLTLIKQGPANFDDVTQITYTDDAMPPHAATVCYYGQLFDEHGNASPLTLLGGDCLKLAGTAPLPTPMLASLEQDGTEAAPEMKIRWFSPPYGVDRFEVFIAAEQWITPPSISSELSTNQGPTPNLIVYTVKGQLGTNDFGQYLTPRIGPGFGNGAQFEVNVTIQQGQLYTVFVKAVGKDGSKGTRSNVEQFNWAPTVLTGPKVPWPARPLPKLNFWASPIVAEQLSPTIFPGVGVRIGEVPGGVSTSQPTASNTGLQLLLSNLSPPMSHIYTNKSGASLFPAALYRFQVVSALYPVVSGDVVQVSPLMEEIAYENTTNANQVPVVAIRDPFIRVTRTKESRVNYMYLVDTQPVLANATYGYVLVRFNAQKEIEEVILTSFVNVVP